MQGPYNNMPRLIRLFTDGLDSYMRNIHKDAAAHMVERIVKYVIDGQYVGWISGDLKRSIQMDIKEFLTVIQPNINTVTADYAGFVADWSKSKYGKNYMKIAVDLYGPETLELMKKEYDRLMKVIDRREKYTYKSPFGVLGL